MVKALKAGKSDPGTGDASPTFFLMPIGAVALILNMSGGILR